MATMENCHCDVEMENTIKLDCGLKKEEIEEAVRVLLKGLGEDIDRQGLVKTPHRVAKALLDATRGYKENVDDMVQGALFPEAGLNDNYKVGQAGGVGGLVIVRDLDLFSLCESCLLPFHVICHVGYVPSGQRVVGLSKLSRVANIFAKRLQHPQRLANEICTNLQLAINPSGVAVFLECFHIHPPVTESSWSLGTASDGFVKVLVSAGSGVFEDCSNDIWSEFFRLMKYKEGMVDKMTRGMRWCPLTGVETVKCDMVRAVDKIIRLLGEDPSRKELAATPGRFTKWLMNFENCDIKMKLNGFISNKNSDIIVKTNGVAKYNKNNTIHYEMNLPFLSQCEHHLLPFHGVVHIGYFIVEGGSPINRSVVQKIVHFFGFKLQVQERCTKQIAETIASLAGKDVIVVVEASHTCMISRGIEKFGSSTATIAVLGRFSTDNEARALFLESLPT
ncbi:GTP cyclohydrolase 1-like [Silene latifolia]|uniref:GTP cyclohydrolase 1-like n=1 Tax=Silene latifolia TaxID=37657 RepID=UPI003D76CB96